MDEQQRNDISTEGVLAAAAFVFVSLYLLVGRLTHYRKDFYRVNLPKFLQEKLPQGYKAIMLTCSLITEDSDWEPMTTKSFSGIMTNFLFRHSSRNTKELENRNN